MLWFVVNLFMNFHMPFSLSPLGSSNTFLILFSSHVLIAWMICNLAWAFLTVYPFHADSHCPQLLLHSSLKPAMLLCFLLAVFLLFIAILVFLFHYPLFILFFLQLFVLRIDFWAAFIVVSDIWEILQEMESFCEKIFFLNSFSRF